MTLALRSLVFVALMLPIIGCNRSGGTTNLAPIPTIPVPTTTNPATTPTPNTTPKVVNPGTEPAKPAVLKAINVFLTDSSQRGPRLSLSPDGSMAVTVIDGAHLWDTASGKELPWKDPETAASLDPKKSVGNAVYSADGSHLWVSLMNRLVVVNAKTHRLKETIPTDKVESWVLRLSPGEKYISTQDALYDVQAKSKKYDYAKEQKYQDEVAFGHDGKTMVGRDSKKISLWNLETGKVAHTIDFKQDGSLASQFIACSPTADIFALRPYSKNDIREVEIRDLTTSEVKTTFGKELKLHGGGLAWSPDGKLLTVVVSLGFVEDSFRYAVWLLDAKSGKPVASLSPFPADSPEAIAFSGDGSKLAILARNPDKDNKMDLIIWDMTQLPK